MVMFVLFLFASSYLELTIAAQRCIIGYQCPDNSTINVECVKLMGHSGVNENGHLMCIPNQRGRNVFGHDNRVQVTSTDYPWKAIGYLNTGCTGTLVGRNLVLTAAHCVIDPNTHKLNNIQTFYPNRINGHAAASSSITNVWWGTTDPDKHRQHDWALLRLTTPLGDQYGYLGSRTLSDSAMLTSSGTLVGYSADFQNGRTAGAHVGCHITKKVSNGFYLHDCDMARGASGGPIFAWWDNQPYIYALNVAENRNGGSKSLVLPDYTEKNANIAIWSSELYNKINTLKNS